LAPDLEAAEASPEGPELAQVSDRVSGHPVAAALVAAVVKRPLAAFLFLATFLVRDIGGLAQLRVRLVDEVFGALGVAAELAVVILLRVFDGVVGLDEVALGVAKLAMVLADVDDGTLISGRRALGLDEDDSG
jgi:hypothetical protein